MPPTNTCNRSGKPASFLFGEETADLVGPSATLDRQLARIEPGARTAKSNLRPMPRKLLFCFAAPGAGHETDLRLRNEHGLRIQAPTHAGMQSETRGPASRAPKTAAPAKIHGTRRIKLKASENRHVAAKKSLAAPGVSEQLGASSMRCSMAARITQRSLGTCKNSCVGRCHQDVAPPAQLPLHVLERNAVVLADGAARRLGRRPSLAEYHFVGRRQAAVLAVALVRRLHGGEFPGTRQSLESIHRRIARAHGLQIGRRVRGRRCSSRCSARRRAPERRIRRAPARRRFRACPRMDGPGCGSPPAPRRRAARAACPDPSS